MSIHLTDFLSVLSKTAIWCDNFSTALYLDKPLKIWIWWLFYII